MSVGCGGNNKSNIENDNQKKQEQIKKEEAIVSNNIKWVNEENNLIAEITVSEVRRFTKDDELYKNIKKNYPDDNLYLINYEYKNGEVNQLLEITLNNFKIYTTDGTLLEAIANGSDSFTGEISMNKKAATDFLIVVPENINLDEVVFEVEDISSGISRKEGKQVVKKEEVQKKVVAEKKDNENQQLEKKEKPKLDLTEDEIYQKFIACETFKGAIKVYNSFSEKYPHFWESNEYDDELLILDRAYDRAIDYFTEKGLT